MPSLAIGNVCFEKELEENSSSFCTSSFFLQLQFLPFLYTPKPNLALITHAPDPNYFSHLRALGISPCQPLYESDPIPSNITHIDSWGDSLAIQLFAKSKGIVQSFPKIEAVYEASSKRFSSELASDGTIFLHSLAEVKEWSLQQTTTCVLKTYLGFSGKGHLIVNPQKPPLPKKIESFCAKEFAAGRAVIAQVWQKRVLDFSTQWKIAPDKSFSYVGATVCINDSEGHYQGTLVDAQPILFKNYEGFFKEHKEAALIALEKLATMGYFGNVGFDAFIYEEEGLNKLYAIVEINARKTMGWVALQLYERLGNRCLSLTLENLEPNSLRKTALLPLYVLDEKGEQIAFKKNLFLRYPSMSMS